MKQLDHPSVVKLLDFYNTENILYIVVEYISGGELFDRIVQHGKYPESRAKILVKNILEAVEYLHKKSIVHRDLKPENILLQNKNSDTDIKIADFGVAREIDTGCKTVIGSLSYIAPEVLQRKDTIKGTGSYGESADMWSVGVITYVILIGGLPFKDEQGMDMYKKVNQLLKFQESYWKSISQTAKDFITQLFQVDPKKRFSAKDCLNHPWISELRTTKTDSASSADDSINTNIIISGSTIEIDDDNKTIETEDENQNENNSSATPNSKKSSRSIQNSPAETRSSKRKKPNSPEKTTIEKGNNNDNRRKSPRTKPSS